MKTNPEYKAYYDREISLLSDGKVKDVEHRQKLNNEELQGLLVKKEENAKKFEKLSFRAYRDWLLNKRDKSGKPISAIYSEVLGFDEVIFVKD